MKKKLNQTLKQEVITLKQMVKRLLTSIVGRIVCLLSGIFMAVSATLMLDIEHPVLQLIGFIIMILDLIFILFLIWLYSYYGKHFEKNKKTKQ